VVLRPRILTLAVATSAALATAAITALPFLRFAYRSPSLHLVMDTAAALISIVAAYLVFARYRDRGQLRDLALVLALGVFAFTNLFFSALPAATIGPEPGKFSTWAPLAGRLLGAMILAGSAFLPDVRAKTPRRAAFVGAGAVGAVLLLFALGFGTFADALPRGIDPALSPESSGRPLLTGHPAVLLPQVAVLVLFAAAAVGFTRRAEETADELMTWFAVGSTVAAFARLNYVLFPSLYSKWIYTGDFFRLAFYVVLLVGAIREIGRYWRKAAEATVLEERRRLARDLHDGLAQELSFISMQAKVLTRRSGGSRELDAIAVAANRALDEARRAVAALTRPLDERLPSLLAETAEELAARAGVRVELDLHEVDVPPETREALLRITREAVTNASRHGRPSVIHVHVADGDGVRLIIRDDGVGFDPSNAARNGRRGFGLVSMKERAEALGGTFRISSHPGEGTEVEVRLP
jgi:signal transduction histidine kinase